MTGYRRQATGAPSPPVGNWRPGRPRTQIGVWYSAWYDAADKFHHWKYTRTPAPPLLGNYTARDPKIIAQQYAAMRECGIDFVIFDDTNTLFVDDSIIDHTIRAWYDFMDALPPSERLGLCVGFGGEINQHQNIESFQKAGEYLAKTFAGRPSAYIIEGHPLLIWYIEKGMLADWSYPGVTVKRAYHFSRPKAQRSRGGWGWGTHPYPLDCPECMSLMPGWYGGRPAQPVDRRAGDYYMDSWLRILTARPQYVTIADWNNFQEATAIEDSPGWTDRYGDSAPDYYRRITQGYAALLHDGVLLPGFCYRHEHAPEVYRWDGAALVHQSEYPHRAPTILLPDGWLEPLLRRR